MQEQYKEYFAEFLGTMILIIFGNGVNCQVVLSSVTGVAASQQGYVFFLLNEKSCSSPDEFSLVPTFPSRSDGASAQLSVSGSAVASQEVTSTQQSP